MSNSIYLEQNKKEYLRYRYVSRKLYSTEKKYRNNIMIIGSLLYIIGLIPLISNWTIAIIAPIIWIPISFLWKRKLKSVHASAVEYHEFYDRQMFDIEELKCLIDNENNLYQNAINITEGKKDKQAFEEMIKKENKISIKNWYSNFKGLPLEVATLLAQDENVTWEKKQREKYKKLLTVGIAIYLVTAFLIYHFTKSWVNVIFTIPIIFEIVEIFADNSDSIKNCNNIGDKLGKAYNYIRDTGKNYNVDRIKRDVIEIQFKIYENRKDSIPVPDIMYTMFRGNLQRESNLYVKAIKRDMINWLKK
ncbi:S-4TM family putative pore-forming effector [Clostridium sp.]|uniref:S-4TM family putative pore-forming effector n=1 Tax=Clostridium sp. TaxID=1506 RepID=UPI002FCAFFA7